MIRSLQGGVLLDTLGLDLNYNAVAKDYGVRADESRTKPFAEFKLSLSIVTS